MNNLDTYEVDWEDEDDGIIYGISIVDEPANMLDFITLSKQELKLQSTNDYPESVKKAAQRGIELNEKVNNECATQTGKIRAQQLANGENISLETVQRMYSYLSRAETYYDANDTEACGTISYLLWGGPTALTWSKRYLEQQETNLKKSKELLKLKESNKEKQLLTGVVLMPEQLIYRNIKGKEFNIKFSRDTIEKLSFEYLKRGFQNNSTFNHEIPLEEGISVVESWLTGKQDKSKDLGFNVPEGTWMVTMKLSDELWKEYIKTGKAKGFSIDSFLNLTKIDFKINNKNMKVKQLLKKAISMIDEKEVKVDMAQLEYDGVTYESESFAEGDLVFIIEEDERKPAAEVSIVNEGMIHTTDEEGRVISVVPEEEVDEVEEVMELLEENKEMKAKLTEALVKEQMAERDKEMEMMKKEQEEVNMKLTKSESKIKELESQLEVTPTETKLKANSGNSDKTNLSFYERLNEINKKVNK